MTKAKAIAISRALKQYGFTVTVEGKPNCAYNIKVSCRNCVVYNNGYKSLHHYRCPSVI